MKGWSVISLNDFGKIVTGKTPSSKKTDEFGDIYPFVTPSDISGHQRYIETERNISEKGMRSHKRILLPKKSVCVVCIGATIGKVCMTNRPSFSNQQINSIVTNPERHDQDFVYYLCLTLKDTLVNYAGGAATPIVNKSTFSSIQVLVPEHKIQRKIAAILSTYNDLIENNKHRIALLEKMAEEIYREWFVRFRFPGHEKVAFVKGVPEGWGFTRLEKAFDFTGGGTPSKVVSRYWDDGKINWFTPSDITSAEGIFLMNSGTQCSEEGLANSSARLFPAYSVMMTSRATIGALGINLTPACTNQGFITCIPNNRYPLTFLYHWLKLTKPHFDILASGSTFAELTKGTFKQIKILTPPKTIVSKFEQVVSPMFKQIENLLVKNRNLTETRNLLLPRLISGKLSVENLAIHFPPSMQAEEELETREAAHA
jgi:type I restriction enzyme, S subunit